MLMIRVGAEQDLPCSGCAATVASGEPHVAVGRVGESEPEPFEDRAVLCAACVGHAFEALHVLNARKQPGSL